MEYRIGRISDFNEVEMFVKNAIFPAFYNDELSEEQLQENDWVIQVSRKSCLTALSDKDRRIFVAYENELAGFIIADKTPMDYPEIDWLMVSHKYQGMGIAKELTKMAIEWIGEKESIKLGVIHFNKRAIKFYEKFQFKDSGKIKGKHRIPRKLMIREVSR